MTGLSLHDACEAARYAGRCRSCGAWPGDPCVPPAGDQPEGFHAARFGQAAARGLLDAEDLTTVARAAPGHDRFGQDTVIYDTPDPDDTLVFTFPWE